jgi:hypothetical protein
MIVVFKGDKLWVKKEKITTQVRGIW